MKNSLPEERNGYMESIRAGITSVRKFDLRLSRGTGTFDEQVCRLRQELDSADKVVVGAGAGLSASAGYIYSGERFEKYFGDFSRKYGFTDMYSGGFFPFPKPEIRWAFWSRNIYINRYMPIPRPVYSDLLQLLGGKDYFVITTNVDHCFQRAGFDKSRLFYTQGDYGLFQSTDPSVRETWDNEEWVKAALAAQGFEQDENGIFQIPENRALSMELPAELIPRCPAGDGAVKMNLRSDDTFVEDAGWHRASAAYAEFLDGCRDAHVIYLELGVGANTPVIIKYPFWKMTAENPKAVYCCVNYGEAFTIGEIASRSTCIGGDIGEVLPLLLQNSSETGCF